MLVVRLTRVVEIHTCSSSDDDVAVQKGCIYLRRCKSQSDGVGTVLGFLSLCPFQLWLISHYSTVSSDT